MLILLVITLVLPGTKHVRLVLVELFAGLILLVLKPVLNVVLLVIKLGLLVINLVLHIIVSKNG